MTVDGEERVVEAGGSAVIPAGVRHSARPLGACRAVVVDHPLRPEAGRWRSSSPHDATRFTGGDEGGGS